MVSGPIKMRPIGAISTGARTPLVDTEYRELRDASYLKFATLETCRAAFQICSMEDPLGRLHKCTACCCLSLALSLRSGLPC
jgi:hypothetical protein